MAPVANIPIIEHIFELLASHGVGEVDANVHYLADALLEAYGEETRMNGMRVCLSREERLLGTAGSVKRLAKHFDETFVVVSGDALTDLDLEDLVDFHKEKGALATMALKRVCDTLGFGIVEVDEESKILSFQEKPDPREALSTLANSGIYVLEPRALDYIPKDTFFDFAKDVFPRFLEAGERFVGYQGDFYWSDIGTLEAYLQAQYDALSGRVNIEVPGERRGEDIWIGENAQIHPTSRLEGCTIVGEDVVVGREVLMAGHVTLGSGCWVRPHATIKRSILLAGSSVGDGAYLEDCIVGYDYNVRPGEIIRGSALTRRSTEVPLLSRAIA